MNISVPVTSLRKICSGVLIAVLSLSLMEGCQSPNVFTAKNDGQSSSPEDAASVTAQPAGLPTPTNARTADNFNSTQSPTSIDEHLRLGEIELEQGNHAQARVHFEHVLQKSPKHVKANHRLGVLSDKLGQYPQAEEHYRTALEGDPRNAALLSDLGYSYWLQGRYSECERYLLEARKHDPNYDKAIANLGLLYGSTGRQEEALAMFSQIGDDAEVQQIMQQIAGGQFQPPQQSLAGQPTSQQQMTPQQQITPQQQQSTVVTTQTTAQHATQVPPQDMNEATREFLEEMRLAREELRRAEQRLALQQAQQGAATPPQQAVTPASGQQQSPEWARHAMASRRGGPPDTQYAGVNPFPDPAGQQAAQQGKVPNAMLAEQMAAIDRRDQQPQQQEPVVIGAPNSNTNPVQGQSSSPGQTPIIQSGQSSLGHASPSPSQAAQFANSQQSEMSQTGSTSPQYWPQGRNHQTAPQTEYFGNPQQNQTPPTGSTFAQQDTQNLATNPTPDASATNASAWRQQYETSLNQSSASQSGSVPPQERPNQSQAIQQLSANQSRSRSAQRPVEHAHHTQQSGQRPEISLAGQADGAASNSLVPPSLGAYQGSQPQQGRAVTPSGNPQQPSVNSYEQARREAAYMGLGAGPGQVFPYIQQTPRSMPGTDSRLNGAQYPPPIRRMPSGLTPPNPNPRTSTSAPVNLAPQNNHIGQPMPAVPAQTTDAAAGSGAASPSYQRYQRTRAENATAETMPYQETRNQQSDQLNGLIDQTWGQSPQSPPHGVTPPSAINQTRTPSPGFSPQTPAGRGAAQLPAQSPNGAQQNWDTMVVPQPYRSEQPPTAARQPQRRQSWTSQSEADTARPYEGPVIVPGGR